MERNKLNLILIEIFLVFFFTCSRFKKNKNKNGRNFKIRWKYLLTFDYCYYRVFFEGLAKDFFRRNRLRLNGPKE
jgi:hypothetical protein